MAESDHDPTCITIIQHRLNAESSTIDDSYADGNYRAQDDEGNRYIVEWSAYQHLKEELIEDLRQNLLGGFLMSDERLTYHAERTLLGHHFWNTEMVGVSPVASGQKKGQRRTKERAAPCS